MQRCQIAGCLMSDVWCLMLLFKLLAEWRCIFHLTAWQELLTVLNPFFNDFHKHAAWGQLLLTGVWHNTKLFWQSCTVTLIFPQSISCCCGYLNVIWTGLRAHFKSLPIQTLLTNLSEICKGLSFLSLRSFCSHELYGNKQCLSSVVFLLFFLIWTTPYKCSHKWGVAYICCEIRFPCSLQPNVLKQSMLHEVVDTNIKVHEVQKRGFIPGGGGGGCETSNSASHLGRRVKSPIRPRSVSHHKLPN